MSPDSRKLSFIDQAMRIHVYDTATSKVTGHRPEPAWAWRTIRSSAFRLLYWSADSRWLTYARPAATSLNNAISSTTRKAARCASVTTGYLTMTRSRCSNLKASIFTMRPTVFDPVRHLRQTHGRTRIRRGSWSSRPQRREVAALRRATIPRNWRSTFRGQEAGRKKPDEKKARRAGGRRQAGAPPSNVDIDLDGFRSARHRTVLRRRAI